MAYTTMRPSVGVLSQTQKFLDRCAVAAGQAANLLSLFGGRYFVPDDRSDEFFAVYAADATKYQLGLVECKKAVFPLIIDFDLDSRAGTADERLKSVKNIMTVLRDDVVASWLELSASELDLPGDDFAGYADAATFGSVRLSHRRHQRYHLIFPSLVVDSAHAVAMTTSLQNALKCDYPAEDWCKIIDTSVAGPNGLRMLGSFKPDVASGYYVPCEVDWTAMRVTDLAITASMLKEHSVRSWSDGAHRLDAMPITVDGDVAVTNADDARWGTTVLPFAALSKGVMRLPEEYYGAGSYEKWSRMIWRICAIARTGGYVEDGLRLAHDFSRQALAPYDPGVLDRMWDKALARTGPALGLRSFLGILAAVDPELCREIRASCGTSAAWDSSSLYAAVHALVPVERSCRFDFKPQEIEFDDSGVRGIIRRRDMSVFVERDFKGHLIQDAIPVDGALSILHRDIAEDMTWSVRFDGDQDSATLATAGAGRSAASILWHHPWGKKSYMTMHLGGVRRGGAVKDRKSMEYLQERVEEAVQKVMQEQYGITQAFFTGCTFNINIRGEGERDRHAEGKLNQMLLAKHPVLTKNFRFCPDVKTANMNGLFACNIDTKIWAQEHNAHIEGVLREKYADVPGLTPDDLEYVWTRRGINDLRGEFAASVQDKTFERRLNANLDLFAVQNGVVDMATKTIRPIRPSDCIRLHAGWKYTPELARLHKDDVRLFLEQLFPVQAERDTALTYIAGLLSGRRVIKKLLVLTDQRSGNNGKSTLVNFLKCFFDAYSKCSNKFLNKGAFDRDRDSHDAGMEPYAGVRLTVLEELKRTTRIDEGLAKSLTGGAGVTVEGRKCGSSENFKFVWQSGFVLVFNEGDCPQFDVTDDAWIGRLLVAPMRSKFVCGAGALGDEPHTFRANANIDKHFPAWCSAMLDVLLEHYSDENMDDAAIPPSMKEWKSDIVDGHNKLGDWLETRLEITGRWEDYVALGKLKTQYLQQRERPVLPTEFVATAKAWCVSKRCTYKAADHIPNGEGRTTARHVVRGCVLLDATAELLV